MRDIHKQVKLKNWPGSLTIGGDMGTKYVFCWFDLYPLTYRMTKKTHEVIMDRFTEYVLAHQEYPKIMKRPYGGGHKLTHVWMTWWMGVMILKEDRFMMEGFFIETLDKPGALEKDTEMWPDNAETT